MGGTDGGKGKEEVGCELQFCKVTEMIGELELVGLALVPFLLALPI